MSRVWRGQDRGLGGQRRLAVRYLRANRNRDECFYELSALVLRIGNISFEVNLQKSKIYLTQFDELFVENKS